MVVKTIGKEVPVYYNSIDSLDFLPMKVASSVIHSACSVLSLYTIKSW